MTQTEKSQRIHVLVQELLEDEQMLVRVLYESPRLAKKLAQHFLRGAPSKPFDFSKKLAQYGEMREHMAVEAYLEHPKEDRREAIDAGSALQSEIMQYVSQAEDELAAWRERFPEFSSRPQDDIVGLKFPSKEASEPPATAPNRPRG